MTGTQSPQATEDGVPTASPECQFCDWEVEKEIVTEADRYDLDNQAERHYEREHCGTVKVKAVFETTMRLPPHKDAREFSDRQHDRMEDEAPPNYELAYTVAETVEDSEGSK